MEGMAGCIVVVDRPMDPRHSFSSEKLMIARLGSLASLAFLPTMHYSRALSLRDVETVDRAICL